MKNAKRGFLADYFIMLILILFIGIFAVVMAYALSLMQNTGNPLLDTSMKNAYDGIFSFNSVAPFVIVALGLALIGSAFLVRTQPIFFILFFVVQIIFAFLSIFLSNAWMGMFSNNAMSSTAALFTGWTLIISNFPFISILLGVIFAIAVFAKGGGG